MDLLVTLQPSFPHFPRYARDERLRGIRLNNPHWKPEELAATLAEAHAAAPKVPLMFDVKGWQLRVTEVFHNDEYLDLRINHPINVATPVVVILKAGADQALLERVEEDGRRLIFRGGPHFLVKPGESLQIRHPTLKVLGEQFLPDEIRKIEVARKAGITRFFLSYVERQADVDRFRELVGRDAEILLKIENEEGLRFVAEKFRKEPNLTLVAARGDLYVEVKRPHLIANALRLIVSKDPEACVGSRFMLSVITSEVPSCADFTELAWVKDIGYRSVMLCDELCLKEELLNRAVHACQSFYEDYRQEVPARRPGSAPATAPLIAAPSPASPAPPAAKQRGLIGQLLSRVGM